MIDSIPLDLLPQAVTDALNVMEMIHSLGSGHDDPASLMETLARRRDLQLATEYDRRALEDVAVTLSSLGVSEELIVDVIWQAAHTTLDRERPK